MYLYVLNVLNVFILLYIYNNIEINNIYLDYFYIKIYTYRKNT